MKKKLDKCSEISKRTDLRISMKPKHEKCAEGDPSTP